LHAIAQAQNKIMIQQITEKLNNVKKIQSGGFSARCPNHADEKNSLLVKEQPSGKITIDCLAGCNYAEVLSHFDLKPKDLYPNGNGNGNRAKPERQPVKTYQYTDEENKLLYESCRYEPKGFNQRRPNGGGGFIFTLDETRRVLYRLPELVKADLSETVFLCEGEKDADNLAAIGLLSTTNAGGADTWRDEFTKTLQQRRVVVCVDRDIAGIKRGDTLAGKLFNEGCQVQIFDPFRNEPIAEKHGKDLSDWLEAGNTAEDLLALIDGIEFYEPPTEETLNEENIESDGKDKQSAKLARFTKDLEVFHTADGECFATVETGGHKENHKLKSSSFRDWLSYQFFKAENAMPSSNSLQDVINGLCGKALFEGETTDVFLRVAEIGGKIYLDLCNQNWQVVEVTKEGWKVLDDSPVKFRRTKGMLPLPTPQTNGNISALREFANVTDDGFILLSAWLVACLRPNRPFPVLVLQGEQGSAKSTTARVLRELIDPNKAPLRSASRNEHELVIAANNSWIISLDNLSMITNEVSDALCRLSTGSGFSARTLFSDNEETIFFVQRPILLNGINDLVSRPDLLDRALLVSLPRIEETARKQEKTFWLDFEQKHPLILGALLDAVSVALANIETTTIERLPRLADFTLWAIAAENGLGLEDGAFLECYTGNRESVHDLVLDFDPLAELIVDFADKQESWKQKDLWTGLPKDFYLAIETLASDKLKQSKDFPKNANALGKRLVRIAPNLRTKGIDYQPPDRSNRAESRFITLRKFASVSSAVETLTTF
jgi:5S rRNA maturation endonuclease (ribonuclease M5)